MDFVVVYTSEAHPRDGWYYDGSRYDIRQHRDLGERIDSARNLFSLGLPCTLLVDTMNNAVSRTFDALPERVCIIRDGRVVFIGGFGPEDYELSEVDLWLGKHI